jgi:hypothetical protein
MIQDTRAPLTTARLNALLRSGESIVVRQWASRMPAIQHWPDAFSTLLSNTRVNPSFLQGQHTFTRPPRLLDIAPLILSQKGYYLHDYPLYLLPPRFDEYLYPVSTYPLPRYYRTTWWRFFRLFWSSIDAYTPFHFDKLGTHNLFIQISGKKRFHVVHRRFLNRCYIDSWKWSSIADVREVDFSRFPLFRGIPIGSVTLFPGDVLLLPAFTLHQARSLTSALSVNIDWHTPTSSVQAFLHLFHGMPFSLVAKNLRFILFTHGIPFSLLFPFSRHRHSTALFLPSPH